MSMIKKSKNIDHKNIKTQCVELPSKSIYCFKTLHITLPTFCYKHFYKHIGNYLSNNYAYNYVIIFKRTQRVSLYGCDTI